MTTPLVSLVGEGSLDVEVLRRLVTAAGMSADRIYRTNGKAKFDKNIHRYNQAALATRSPWVALRDLHRDQPCAGALVGSLLGPSSPFMVFRVAVRSVESWLMADRHGLAGAFDIQIGHVPLKPEDERDAKLTMLNLMRRSQSRRVQGDMVVTLNNGNVAVGPQYNESLIRFVGDSWNPADAAEASPSLARARRRLREFAGRLRTEARSRT